jgi:hypothetical protein
MKKVVSVTLLLLLSLLLFATPAFAQGGDGGQVVFGDNFTLESGETLEGDLVVFGGNVELEEESVVNGSVAVFGGNVEVAGEIRGDLAAIGGNIKLEDTAVVTGDLANIGGKISQDEGAVVRGNIERVGGDGGFACGIPRLMPVPGVPLPPAPPSRPSFSPFGWFVGELFEAIIWTLALMAIALLVTLFLPQHTDLTARTIAQYPLLSFGVGFLTLIIGTIVGAVLSIICLGVFVLLLLAIALLFGWIAAGYLVGQRLMDALKKSWSPLWSSVIGVGLITVLAHAPFCLGFLFFVIVASMGLGAVILTRFGSTPYIPSTPPPPPVPPSPPAPPAPPPPPAPTGEAEASPPAPTEGTEHPEEDVPEEWEVVEEDEPEDAAGSKKDQAALSTNPPWAYGPFHSAWSYS